MPKPRASIRRQYGAIPYTIDGSGRVRVALLTSRETQRWVIPKGWPMAKRSATAAARREVLEEGGLIGTIINMKPIGHYRYSKRFPVGKVVTCRVAVFLLRVRRVLDVWPEQNQRLRAWFSPEIAAKLVSEKGLSAILLKLTPTVLRLARGKSREAYEAGGGFNLQQSLLLDRQLQNLHNAVRLASRDRTRRLPGSICWSG